MAGGGIQALAQVRSERFDLVLLDCQMPDLDGYQVAARIRGHPSGATIPIIALTASATEAVRERCLAVGMNAVLSKPLDLPVARPTLDHWIGRSRRARGPRRST